MVIYSEKCDNDLLHLAQEGDKQAEEQLALRYSRLVKICSRPFFLAGGDGEDRGYVWSSLRNQGI